MRWEQRPIEIAYLLNPAFCAVLLLDAVRAYTGRDKKGMSYFLVFLVLPLLLHGNTRRNIPTQTRLSLLEWTGKQRLHNVLLAEHVRQLSPFTKEALIFAIQQGVLRFDDAEQNASNILLTSKSLLTNDLWSQSAETKEFQSKAGIVGGWFGEIGDVATIYRALGIYP